MNDKTRKKIVFVVFIAAIIWGVYNFLPASKDKAQKTSSPSSATSPVIEQTTPRPVSVNKSFIDVEEKALEQWGQDPFRANPKRQSKTPRTFQSKHWDLSGILYNDKYPVAIINKNPVKVGDTVNNAEIIKIDKKEVVIDYNGARITLTVAKG